MKTHFETFEHEADIGVRGFGTTMEEAFENAARGLYSVMVNIDAVKPIKKRSVAVSASDSELLLVEWLNALLSLSDVERMVFSKFAVTRDGATITGIAWGEELDRERHMPRVEVKAATYHMLRVDRDDGRYVAQCVVDV
ncbi:MAG TPA: hypothetical protein DCO77_14345 [Nitrospiraceae bacterium]|nr:hypothetical protein [Nitrospiraceae bacterium]